MNRDKRPQKTGSAKIQITDKRVASHPKVISLIMSGYEVLSFADKGPGGIIGLIMQPHGGKNFENLVTLFFMDRGDHVEYMNEETTTRRDISSSTGKLWPKNRMAWQMIRNRQNSKWRFE